MQMFGLTPKISLTIDSNAVGGILESTPHYGYPDEFKFSGDGDPTGSHMYYIQNVNEEEGTVTLQDPNTGASRTVPIDSIQDGYGVVTI